jgi:hypothetical protein
LEVSSRRAYSAIGNVAAESLGCAEGLRKTAQNTIQSIVQAGFTRLKYMDASVLDAREHTNDTLIIGGSAEMVDPPGHTKILGDNEARNESSEHLNQITDARPGHNDVSPVILEQKPAPHSVLSDLPNPAPSGKAQQEKGI